MFFKSSKLLKKSGEALYLSGWLLGQRVGRDTSWNIQVLQSVSRDEQTIKYGKIEDRIWHILGIF